MTSSQGSNLGHLIRLIEAQSRLLAEELRPVVAEIQSKLIGDRLDGLQRLAERETALAGQLAALEAQRVAVVAVIARSLGVSEEEALSTTLKQLLRLLPASRETGHLAEAAEELDREVRGIGWLNADNHHLTRNRLEYTDFVMKLITRSNGTQRYSADGRVLDGPPARAMLDDTI